MPDYRPDTASTPQAKNLRLIALLSALWADYPIAMIRRVRYEGTEGWAMWEIPPGGQSESISGPLLAAFAATPAEPADGDQVSTESRGAKQKKTKRPRKSDK